MPKRQSSKRQALIKIEPIAPVIRVIRGQRVILDSDLAEIYGTSTMRLNEQVKRNKKKFPSDFMFRLTKPEWESLISQIAISNRSQIVTGRLRSQIVTSKKGRGGRRSLPYVFTEHGR